jgi:hypothetical protein
MHRAGLQSVLVDALPPERVHAGHRFTGLRDLGDRARRPSRTATGSRSTC